MAELSPQAQEILDDMYSAASLKGFDGEVDIDQTTRVARDNGSELRRLVRESGAKKSLEVGLAYGFSTIWIMDGLAEGGSHVALDPFQTSYWKGVGVVQAQRFAGKNFTHLEEYSIHAFSDFIRAGEKFDFIFIDGNHRFDDVLVDFYLADQVLNVGGIMVLDDTWMASIKTVHQYVLTNRAYQRVPHRGQGIEALRKERDDDRSWRHFRPFAVTRDQEGGLD